MPRRILITGSSGYIGSKVVALLAKLGSFEIYGIDTRRPPNCDAYTHFIQGSVTDRDAMRSIFGKARADVAIHLAFVVTTTHDRRREESVAIEGTRHFLDGCDAFAVRRVVFMSSAAAYGAHDDNDAPLRESSPIRGVEGYGYSRLKAATDRMAKEFMASHTGCEFVLLRPCLFVGPNTDNNFFDVLKYPIVPQISDGRGARDPEFQFIHEDDMAACLVAAIEKPVRGIFNCAGDGTAPFSELVRRFGKHSIAIPSWVLYPLTSLLWKLHLVTSPPALLDFIRYPWIMDTTRMRHELFVPAKTSIEAFDEFVRTHRKHATSSKPCR